MCLRCFVPAPDELAEDHVAQLQDRAPVYGRVFVLFQWVVYLYPYIYNTNTQIPSLSCSPRGREPEADALVGRQLLRLRGPLQLRPPIVDLVFLGLPVFGIDWGIYSFYVYLICPVGLI